MGPQGQPGEPGKRGYEGVMGNPGPAVCSIKFFHIIFLFETKLVLLFHNSIIILMDAGMRNES